MMSYPATSDLIPGKLKQQIELISKTCSSKTMLSLSREEIHAQMLNLGKLLVETDVYFCPSPSVEVQEKTMQVLVDLLESPDGWMTTRHVQRNLMLDIEYGVKTSTIHELQSFYVHIVLYAYIYDCMYRVPFDRTFIYLNDLVPDVLGRWLSLIDTVSNNKDIPLILHPIYEVLLLRCKLMKDYFERITSDRRDDVRKVTRCIFQELMSCAWDPDRYFAWCLDVEEQRQLRQRWDLI